MKTHPPLSLLDAQVIWQRRVPWLRAETVNYLRKAPLTRPERLNKTPTSPKRNRQAAVRPPMDLANARLALVRNVSLHEEIEQELAAEFFWSVRKEKIWADETSIDHDGKCTRTSWADHWLNRVHKRIARRLGLHEAKEYLLRGTSSSEGDDDGGGGPPKAACLASDYSSPEEIASAREILLALAPTLATLSKEECSILRDRIEGISYPEIAQNLNISEEAARSSMHRLRKHKLLAPNKEPGPRNAHRSSKKIQKPATKAEPT